MQTKTIAVDGIPMRWLEDGAGDGLPVVMIHGIPTGPALWREVMPRVTGGRCLAWEMVGYGGSMDAGRDRDISVAAQAGYLLDWMDELAIGRAILCGHDLGGGVAQIAAVRRPEACAGLLLTNSICYDSWPIPSVKSMRAMGGALEHVPDGMLKPMLAMFYKRGHDDDEAARAALEAHWPHYHEHDGAAAFVRQMKALNVEDTKAVADRLPTLKVPARVVWGDDDQFQKLAYGERLARDLDAPLRHIPGGKHFTPEDHPDVLAEELNALIAEVHRADEP
ncbi:alpha/beta fold hydrolase [Caenispirillum salinarum]|uniref:alpha/beta fold hydrolase n=1 Tax=Caenispirillum salinarum TaxID=859058 RepID=UPI00384F5DCD